ncbi:MAG: helix-turn-helix transcriptional regulator [Candidatus Lustribacter sp.]|jgi:DNA-binding CsgD family transcriptional regulator
MVASESFWDCGYAASVEAASAKVAVCERHLTALKLDVPAPVMPLSALALIDTTEAEQAPRFFLVDRDMHLVGDAATDRIAEYVPLALAALAPYAGRELPDIVELGTECRLLLVKLGSGAFNGTTIVFVQTPRLSAALRHAIQAYGLTEREGDVLRLAVASSNAEIAAELSIAASTVSDHMQNVFRKLGCSRRAQMLTKLFVY